MKRKGKMSKDHLSVKAKEEDNQMEEINGADKEG